MRIEGVIKYTLDHRPERLSEGEVGEQAASLAAWRRVLRSVGLLGQEPGRYEGAGYGNLSRRARSGFEPPGRRSFVITGSQTSGRPTLGLADVALVESYDYRANRVSSRGATTPSSEAMTHGALYDMESRIETVFHAHSPDIWRQARALALPTTDPEVAYGTPEMALEVRRLYRLGDLRDRRLMVMGGHEDGVLAFGRSPEDAGCVLIGWLARAYALG